MRADLSGKAALLTAPAWEMGKSIADLLPANRARVAFVDRDAHARKTLSLPPSGMHRPTAVARLHPPRTAP